MVGGAERRKIMFGFWASRHLIGEMQATDDLKLLREYAINQSESAFETVVSRYVRLVYSAALRQTRDPHLAEEVTQVVFTILATKAGILGDRTILSGWLFKTTRLVAMAQTRTAARQRHYEQEFQMQSEVQSNPPDPIWERISPLLDKALMQLSEKDRQAVLLRYFEDRSLAEIGGSFGIGEDAARMRINRALEKLHRYFSRQGIASTLVVLAGTLSANSVGAAPLALAKTVSVVAAAQGAATHGSTLILIEAALKLMAWTKAKTAIAVGAALLLTTGTGVVTTEIVHAVRAAHYPDIQGAWEGVMLLDEAGVAAGETSRTRLVLKITRTNGQYSATSDWIELGRKDVPMGKVSYDYPALRIQRNIRETWKLTLNDAATQMILDHAVHFTQNDPVLLRRTKTPASVPEKLLVGEFTPRPGSDLQGYWKGTIGTGQEAFPVSLKIAEQADGTFRAEGDDPMQGAIGRPVLVTYQRPSIKFMVASGTGMFEGQVNNDNSEIKGSWIQDGQSTPASIKRADYESEHALETLQNYSFASQEELQGHWRGSWIVPFGDVKVTIRCALDIAKLPDGSYLALLANIDQFGYDAPIAATDFHYEQRKVRMGWKWAGGKYEGRLKDGKLIGTWFQGGGGFPLVFERSGAT
jgi:RNA polymerase sigma factor (sigma-70 family)